MNSFRDNTNDHLIYRAVVYDNEYMLPESLAGKVVMDIGTHIGSFVFAALKRGAKKVYGFEPHIGNFITALNNVMEMPGAEISNIAVWRSDRSPRRLRVGQPHDIDPSCNGLNMGSASLGDVDRTQLDANWVWAIPLDDLLNELGSVDLLKIDCEGSEWPILLTSRLLSPASVKRIVGEYHELTTTNEIWKVGDGHYTKGKLDERLAERGYQVKWHAGENPMGLFTAEGP